MAGPDVNSKIDDAVSRGDYPDRKAAAAGLMKQLIDYQKGLYKDRLKADPVANVEGARDERWKALLERAGGDPDKAAQLYADEIKKI